MTTASAGPWFGPVCPVEGCHRPASGPPVSFRKAPMLLCPEHRRAYTRSRSDWDGTLDPTGHSVLRLHPRRARSR